MKKVNKNKECSSEFALWDRRQCLEKVVDLLECVKVYVEMGVGTMHGREKFFTVYLKTSL